MENKEKYLDENGLPGTIGEDGQFDGGDTAAILGTLWAFGLMQDKRLPFAFEAADPVPPPARHADSTRWYGQPDRFSRDQLIAVLCGLSLGYWKADRRGWGHSCKTLLCWSHKKRFFLTAWNTRKNGSMDAPKKFPDITGPEVWALWLRIFKPRYARFLLPILDLELLLSALHWRFLRKDRVTRNHMLSVLACNRTMPTITSKLAYKITDFDDLINRWDEHCKAVGEYPTADLFREYLNLQ